MGNLVFGCGLTGSAIWLQWAGGGLRLDSQNPVFCVSRALRCLDDLREEMAAGGMSIVQAN